MNPTLRCGLLISTVIFLQAKYIIEACHNSQHVRPTSDLDISGRRKRDVFGENETMPRDADPDLSIFFTDCLTRRAGRVFESWRSVMDFILRDTVWFEATDAVYCSGRKDTAKCWQRRLRYLLKSQSSLKGPAKECISDFDRSVKDDMGPEFELYYRTYYESFEYEPAYGEFKRWKRDVFGRARSIINSLDHQLDVRFTTSRTYFLGETVSTTPTYSSSIPTTTPPPQLPERTCPVFSLIDYAVCVADNVKQLIDSDIINEYPSLINFDEQSNFKFVTDHYTSCRITKENKDGEPAYIENCYTDASQDNERRPTKPPKSKPPKKPKDIPPIKSPPLEDVVPDIISIDPCLILDLPEIVTRTSPIYPTVSGCSEWKEETTTPETNTISTTPVEVYERPYKKGRQGKCTKGDHWTKWFNMGKPNGEGEMETLSDLREKFRGQICENPKAVDARTAVGHKYHSGTNNLVYLSVNDGLRCFNHEQEQGPCVDFKIRFCCPIEVPPCEGLNGWTPWLNRDSAKKDGIEDESLSKHVVENGVCSSPVAIRARMKNKQRHYWKGYNTMNISPQSGLICKNSDQLKGPCRDYEVSFCCPY